MSRIPPLGRRFVKGQSGNPGGRPKAVKHLQELARENMNLGINTLIEVASNPEAPHTARVTAAVALLDRGFGRPMQTVNSNVSRVDPDKLTDAELAEYLTSDSSGESAEAEGDTERLN